MSRNFHIEGKRFGRLTVMRRVAPTIQRPEVWWFCRCECGRFKTVLGYRLRHGITKSCGCLIRESAARSGRLCKTHGRSKTNEYRCWAEMFQRCTNSNRCNWKYYGGRGIKVCKRWRKFENFFTDMGLRPKGKTLDRFPNNNGNYEPGNCRWATHSQQQKNRRKQLRVERAAV